MAHSQTLHGVTQWTLSGKGGIHLFLSRNNLDIRKADSSTALATLSGISVNPRRGTLICP